MDKNKFGTYIKEKRIEHGFTQKELADRLMIDVSAVSKWERGVTYPDITILPEICKHLNVSEHELIASSNDTEARAMALQAKKYNRLKNGIFYSFSIAYAIAVITCFIVNIAVEHRLSWFFIVAASCLCGFTFVPSVLRFVDRFRLGVYVLSTFVGLFAVYLVCSLYTGNNWVWTATAGTALGYFVFFSPVLMALQKRYLHEERYRKIKKFFLLIYAFGTAVLTVVLLWCVARYTAALDLTLALKITGYGYTVLFAYGLTELLPKVRRCVKIGIDFLWTGGYLFGLNGVMNILLDQKEKMDYYYRIDFSNWDRYSNGNVTVLAVGCCATVGVLLILVGLFSKQKNKA